MKKPLFNNKGFTLTEVLFVAVISVIVITGIVSTWSFTYTRWTMENKKTLLRVDLMKALETIQEDIRLSSATAMTFYPSIAVGGVYTSISMPIAETDGDGLFTLNGEGNIEWDKTVIYHIFTDLDGDKSLRRTVFNARDNTLTLQERFDQLTTVIVNGEGGDGTVTETLVENLQNFSIGPFPVIVDFYEDSATPVKVNDVSFGRAILDASDHDITFEVVGKNDSSSGYGFGIDSIKIEPCGSNRDVEYYDTSFAPSGSINSSGDTINTNYGTEWSNYNYLEYLANSDGDYIAFNDYYDLWRDSAFLGASLSNVSFEGNSLYAELEMPEDRLSAGITEISWYAFHQTADTTEEGRDGNLPAYPITIRTILDKDHLTEDGDMVRVKLVSSSENPLMVSAVYITRRDEDEDGYPNLSTGGLNKEEYHLHQQLFFKDVYDGDNDGDTDEILPQTWIPAGSDSHWSEWVAFPLELEDSLGAGLEYFITFCIPDLDSVTFPVGWSSFNSFNTHIKYWQGAMTNTYYIDSGDYTTQLLPAAGTPVWSSGAYTNIISSNDVFVSAEVDTWKSKGTVESNIFDTELSSPNYNQIKWSEYKPSGTSIAMKARSSNDPDMIGATDWPSVPGSSANPHNLSSIGTGRYFQYYAELSTNISWSGGGTILAYNNYVDEQVGLADYVFPTRSGEYLISGVYSTWIDDVEVDWPGNTKMCVVSGTIARKNNYGKVKITIDGKSFLGAIEVFLSLSQDFQDGTITESNGMVIEPRNTGK